jgi:hypothetical protein
VQAVGSLLACDTFFACVAVLVKLRDAIGAIHAQARPCAGAVQQRGTEGLC